MQDRRLRFAGQRARLRLRHQPWGECVTRLVAGLDVSSMLRLGQYRRAWDSVVPDELRGHTRVLGVHRRVLTIAVDGAAQRYVLQVSLRPTLLGALNQVCRGRPLRDLRFVLADAVGDQGEDGTFDEETQASDAL